MKRKRHLGCMDSWFRVISISCLILFYLYGYANYKGKQERMSYGVLHYYAHNDLSNLIKTLHRCSCSLNKATKQTNKLIYSLIIYKSIYQSVN